MGEISCYIVSAIIIQSRRLRRQLDSSFDSFMKLQGVRSIPRSLKMFIAAIFSDRRPVQWFGSVWRNCVYLCDFNAQSFSIFYVEWVMVLSFENYLMFWTRGRPLRFMSLDVVLT